MNSNCRRLVSEYTSQDIKYFSTDIFRNRINFYFFSIHLEDEGEGENDV
jgi:hypothetical protein